MTSYSLITPTLLGAGVAKTSIGTNSKPSESQNLIEFIPYYAPSGLTTTVESFFLETAIESVSVKDILPKRIINAPIQAGLGATYAVMIPILEAYSCNTPLQSGSNDIIEAFGQAQIANTVDPTMGVALHYSDSQPIDAQMYYDKPDNETSTGTAATTVTGNTITINGGKSLEVLMAEVAAVTPLAGDSIIGSMQFNSPNFDNSQALEVPVQPVGQGLGATLAFLQPKAAIYKNVSMGMKSTCTITPVYRQTVVLNAAFSFIAGVGYTKV